jgi:hypothetical protein
MAGHGPFLALVLPMLDMADPPPLPTPPMPAGASRIEAHTGWYLAADQGIEAEAGLTGAGYLVRLHDGSTTKRATLGTRASLTFFTPGESEMPLDRYWLGPFGRVEVGSELMGRHSGLGWGQVNRATLDLGLRSALGASAGASTAMSVGYGVVHDREIDALTHGIRLQVDFALR